MAQSVLIETLWNVKRIYVFMKAGENLLVLIETLWNVKPFLNPSSHSCIYVLIETLWNVKLYDTTANEAGGFVLIETLWNVKFTHSAHPAPSTRFNRNIVECKGMYSAFIRSR